MMSPPMKCFFLGLCVGSSLTALSWFLLKDLSSPREMSVLHKRHNANNKPFQADNSQDGFDPSPSSTPDSMETLPTFLTKCAESDLQPYRRLYEQFRGLFILNQHKAKLRLHPVPFKEKMSAWLGQDPGLMKEATEQNVLFIKNVWTGEDMVFNSLRGKRPSFQQDARPESSIVEDLTSRTRAQCDFCNYKEMMGSDEFGRIERKFAFTTTNAFKLDSLHGMAAMRTHHPTRWALHECMDMFYAAQQWFHEAYTYDPRHIYPTILWDLMPMAGGSQVHPHIHMSLNKHRYYGSFDVWQQAASRYHDKYGNNYFDDLVEVHRNVQLAVTHGKATAFVSLTPRKDKEIIVISSDANEDFFKLVYHVLRAYLDDMDECYFSMAITLPPMDNIPGLPAIARMVPRGSKSPGKSDICSTELFAAPNISIDSFILARLLRNSVERQMKSEEHYNR